MFYPRRSLSERLETENSRRREESAALRQRMEKEKEELRDYIDRDVGQVRSFFNFLKNVSTKCVQKLTSTNT